MKAEPLIGLMKLFAAHELDVVVDGGWGVDALLGEQTRPHEDLDIAIPHKDVPKLRKLLADRGYRDVPRDDTRDCNFVLGDREGNLIDVHSYTFDESGNNIFGVQYLPEHFEGNGVIAGFAVKCIPADWAVRFHTGYDLDENDFRDVKALCEKFSIPLPAEYDGFAGSDEREK